MTASSPRRPLIPRSSSLPDLDSAVQELLDLRKEKEKYKELQALLRQSLANYKEQAELLRQAEYEFREKFKSITDISLYVEEFVAWQNYVSKSIMGGLKDFIYVPKADRPKFIKTTHEEMLGTAIQHHEKALVILKETLDALQDDEENQKDLEIFKVEFDSSRIAEVDDPTLIGT